MPYIDLHALSTLYRDVAVALRALIQRAENNTPFKNRLFCGYAKQCFEELGFTFPGDTYFDVRECYKQLHIHVAEDGSFRLQIPYRDEPSEVADWAEELAIAALNENNFNGAPMFGNLVIPMDCSYTHSPAPVSNTHENCQETFDPECP